MPFTGAYAITTRRYAARELIAKRFGDDDNAASHSLAAATVRDPPFGARSGLLN
jgi:hypothetical protein